MGVLGRHFGLWSLNASRIVYVMEEEASPLRRYGFAFGTLPGHVERGEERFTVEWHRAEDSVSYEVFAFARPATRWPGWARRSCGWSRDGSRRPPCGPWLRPSMPDVPRPVGDRYISLPQTPSLGRSGMKRGRAVAGTGQMAVMNTFAVVGLGLAFFLL